ncbi:MAG TPA: MFS transporter [Gammaproteobacteria bacterium]|nr:MFS transporter [Gammaproteobacteria bacterium]
MSSLERNVNLYPWFSAASSGHAWITVFFLYMSQHLALEQVIELSAIYYLSVFVLEVPSGYFSDRIGRRSTLLIAAGALIGSYGCFIVGAGFGWFAVGQFLLAAGIAMQSGTDTAFHYDSLNALGRESEYASREAKAGQWGMTMLALATFSGGLLAMIDLRLAYVFSLASAIAMAILAWRFVEPGHASETQSLPRSFVAVLIGCLARLRDPVLGWIFLVVILLYALAHIVFEFYQPYILLLRLPVLDDGNYAPLLSGLVISVSMFGGALGARASISWRARLGLIGVLAVAMLIQLGIVGAMAIAIDPLVLALVCFRNFPMALVQAPVRAAIAPRISREQRATYLSLQGLAERLFFALLLLWLASGLERGAAIAAPVLLDILLSTLWLGVVVALLLFLLAPRIRRHLSADDIAG